MIKKLCLILVSFFFLTAWAQASSIVDQDQPIGTIFMAAFYQGDLAQSFQTTSGNISGAGIFLWNIGSTDTVTISLWTALPDDGGTMLASASATGTAGSWVDVYWDAVSLTPGVTYYLVFSGNTTLGIAGSTDNPYAYGEVYANSGYDAFTYYDYTFRTYTETGADAVPEPATMLLLGLGLVGAAVAGKAWKKK